MAKSSYQIPTSIDRSMLDYEIVISGGGMQLKPLPLKVILYWIGVLFLLLWALLQSPVSRSPWWLMIIFSIWLLATASYFGQYTRTKELKVMELGALFSYLPRGNRRVITRRSSDPYGFMSLVGIREIEPDGLIRYLDNSVGQIYQVVGSASVLLFDADRTAIVHRVDGFYRKIDTHTEWVWVTTKEPQRVYHQLANAERQNLALRPENRHPELRELMDEKYEILRDDVGGKFSSIHQYLVLRSKNLDHLRAAHQMLLAEVESSTAMIKECVQLDDRATLEMLATVYGGSAARVETTP